MKPMLACPICAAPLQREAARWLCAQRHSFDIAREGYVNLLPVHHRHSAAPGDTPDAIAARRAFLDAGHYAVLREAVADAVAQAAPQTLLDVGCGEGWYTAAMAAQAAQAVGLDIARPAVRQAARRYPGPSWVVGSGARLPLLDASVDLLATLFTPLHVEELARVTRSGGTLLFATPGADHLESFRAALFEQVQPHVPEKFLAGFAPYFEPEARQDLRAALDLDRGALAQLLAMTPYAWKSRPERRAALQAQPGLATTAAFCLMRLRRTPTPVPAR